MMRFINFFWCGIFKTMINAWKLAKNNNSFNVLPTEVKEKFDIENSSYEPKNMKFEIATSGN